MLFFFDSPAGIALMILSFIIAAAAQMGVKRTFHKYAKQTVSSNLTGASVATMMVQDTGVSVIESRGGHLSDHFDPRKKVIALSPDVYHGKTVSALGVAAHEAGHALQYDQGYVPIKVRNSFLPVAQIGSYAAMPLILIGLFAGAGEMRFLIDIGILCLVVALMFQVFTLPVELNASRRAIAILDRDGYLAPSEMVGAKAVLRAAALTYVAAIVTAILQIVRLVLISRGGGRRR